MLTAVTLKVRAVYVVTHLKALQLGHENPHQPWDQNFQ